MHSFFPPFFQNLSHTLLFLSTSPNSQPLNILINKIFPPCSLLFAHPATLQVYSILPIIATCECAEEDGCPLVEGTELTELSVGEFFGTQTNGSVPLVLE